jgi:hypothetical protein
MPGTGIPEVLRDHTRQYPVKPRVSTGQLFFPNIFIPNLRVAPNVLTQHRGALLGIHIDNLHAQRAQPIDSTWEIPALAHDHRPKSKLPNQAAAVPARRQRCHHDEPAIASLPSSVAKGIGFSMQRRIAILHAPVVTRADKISLAVENRRADRDAAFGKPFARFVDRHLQHGRVIGIRHVPIIRVDQPPSGKRRSAPAILHPR